MAESTVPDGGLGVFTAREIPKNEEINSGDVVIQIRDKKVKTRLRQLHNGNFESQDKGWLLEHYLWNAALTSGEFEADVVSSVVRRHGSPRDPLL